MESIRESKEYKALERALMKRLKAKLVDPFGKIKTKPDAVIRDLVQRYMNAWVIASNAQNDIEANGNFCLDDRGRRYANPCVRSLADAEVLMSRLLRDMEIKTKDLAAETEEDNDEL